MRGGTWRSEQGETSEAIYLTSGYTYDDAAPSPRASPARTRVCTIRALQNPTVQMLEERIALMEGAEACRAQAVGHGGDDRGAAVPASARATMSSPGAPRSARAAGWSIPVAAVRHRDHDGDGRDNAAWEAAIRPNTKVFFFETPANPTMDIVDLEFVCGLARSHGIVSVVDNAFCTAALQRPLEFGADVVAYSATKLMDGQGRVLAGAVCGSAEFISDRLLPFQRNTGPDPRAVQRLGGAEGAGNARPARLQAERERAQVGRFVEDARAGNAPPGPAEPSAA